MTPVTTGYSMATRFQFSTVEEAEAYLLAADKGQGLTPAQKRELDRYVYDPSKYPFKEPFDPRKINRFRFDNEDEAEKSRFARSHGENLSKEVFNEVDRYLDAKHYPYKILDPSYGNNLNFIGIWNKIEEVAQIVQGCTWMDQETKSEVVRSLHEVQDSLHLRLHQIAELEASKGNNH